MDDPKRTTSQRSSSNAASTDTVKQAEDFSGSPIAYIRFSIEQLPVLKWAAGVGTLAMIVVMIAFWHVSAVAIIFGSLAIFVGMFGLLIFSALVHPPLRRAPRPPLLSVIMLWSFALLIIAASALAFSGLFFNRPIRLRDFIIPEPANPNISRAAKGEEDTKLRAVSEAKRRLGDALKYKRVNAIGIEFVVPAPERPLLTLDESASLLENDTDAMSKAQLAIAKGNFAAADRETDEYRRMMPQDARGLQDLLGDRAFFSRQWDQALDAYSNACHLSASDEHGQLGRLATIAMLGWGDPRHEAPIKLAAEQALAATQRESYGRAYACLLIGIVKTNQRNTISPGGIKFPEGDARSPSEAEDQAPYFLRMSMAYFNRDSFPHERCSALLHLSSAMIGYSNRYFIDRFRGPSAFAYIAAVDAEVLTILRRDDHPFEWAKAHTDCAFALWWQRRLQSDVDHHPEKAPLMELIMDHLHAAESGFEIAHHPRDAERVRVFRQEFLKVDSQPESQPTPTSRPIRPRAATMPS